MDAADHAPARPALPVAAGRHPLVAAVGAALRDRCAVDGGPLVVGVSGGADSVALLGACAIVADRRPPRIVDRLVAVHVHHHLRGAAADEDQRHVQRLAARLGVECVARDVHPRAGGGNIAHAARALRYAALAEAAATCGAAHVAVAHHADDQLETMLIALARGAGPDGLSGMRWARPLTDTVTLVRPLLAVRAAACEDFCRAAEITWRTDATNDDPHKPRGRLRRDVMPVVEALWPDAAARATASADALAVAAELFNERVAQVFGAGSARAWPRAALREQPVPILAAGLRRAALAIEPAIADDLGQRHLLPAAEHVAASDEHPRTFDWPGGLRVEITAREVRIARNG